MKIIANDGKIFKTVEECKSYELDLELIKQKEVADRKAKEEIRQELVHKIKQKSNELNDLLNNYEKYTGSTFIFWDMDFPNVNISQLLKKLANDLKNY